MPRTKLPVSPHGGSPDETEAMFYEALQKGDVDLLMSCWAEDDEMRMCASWRFPLDGGRRNPCCV